MHRSSIYPWSCALSNMHKGSPQVSFHTTDIRRFRSRKGSCCSETNCERVIIWPSCHLLLQLTSRFNKRREDFLDLRSYNDYLEEVEDISTYFQIILNYRVISTSTAFNLINEIDLPQTEARINAYRAENAALIERNIHREEAYAQALKDQEDAERREREQRAMELRREEEEEKEEREKGRREIIDKLETSDKNAARVIAKSRANALKRSTARSSTSVSQSNATLLRTRAGRSTAVPDVPHVPLQDCWYAYEDRFVLRSGYEDFMSEAVRKDREGIMRGGGYRIEEAWERAVRSAVAALDLPPLPGLDTLLLPAPESNGSVIMAL